MEEEIHLRDLLKDKELKIVMCDDVRDAEVVNGKVVKIKKEHPKCSACGKEFDIWDEQEDFSFDKYIGYGSNHDEEHIQFKLCCDCFDKIFEVIKPMIKDIKIEEYDPWAGCESTPISEIDIDKLLEDDSDDILKIDIDVNIENSVNGNIVSENIKDRYDEQTLEDLYDFAANVEGIVERKFIIENYYFKKDKETLLDRFDFYYKDDKENQKAGSINLELINNKSTVNNRIEKNTPYNLLVSVTINGEQFDSYNSALKYFESLLEIKN